MSSGLCNPSRGYLLIPLGPGGVPPPRGICGDGRDQEVPVALPVLLSNPGQFPVTVSLGSSNFGFAMHFTVPPMGCDGEGHAQPDDGRRAPPLVRHFNLLGDASPSEKPDFRRLGTSVPR